MLQEVDIVNPVKPISTSLKGIEMTETEQQDNLDLLYEIVNKEEKHDSKVRGIHLRCGNIRMCKN